MKSASAKLLYMDRSDFNRILGNINKYLKKDYDGEFDTKFSTVGAPVRHRMGGYSFGGARGAIMETHIIEED